MKKRITVILITFILLCISLIPQISYCDDGGSVLYTSLIYRVMKHHTMLNENKYRVGYTINIFGIKVYDNTYIESIIE